MCAIRIQRNTQAPAEFAGRAASPTMRQSGTTLSMQQQAIAAEGAVTKLAFNGAMAVAGGLAAGMSGQTTKDLASIAQSGKMADGSDVKDVNDFEVGKFMNETVSVLGGVEGLMEGVEKQNVAVNMVNDYQKGVAIGQGHVKQQSESVITNATATADVSFKEDMARGNYDGAIDRSWKAHQDSLTKAMNDPNTTPAVKQKIQEYMNSDVAIATFKSKYVSKEANAIAQRTAKNANAVMEIAVKSGDIERQQAISESQRANGEVFRTPEQEEALIHETTYNSLSLNAQDLNKTPRQLTEFEQDIKKRDDLSNEEKTKLVKEAEMQKSINKNVFMASMENMMHDPQLDNMFEAGVNEGYLTKGDVEKFKKKYFGETANADPNLGLKLNQLFSNVKSADSVDEMRVMLAAAKNLKPTTGNKAQDVLMDEKFSSIEKYIDNMAKAPTQAANRLFQSTREQSNEVVGGVLVKDRDARWWQSSKLDELNPLVLSRKAQASEELDAIETEVISLMEQGKKLEATDTYSKRYSEWVAKYQEPKYAQDIQPAMELNETIGIERSGTPEEIQKRREFTKATILKKRQDRIKKEEDKRIEEELDIKVREADIKRKPSGGVKGSTESFLRFSPVGKNLEQGAK